MSESALKNALIQCLTYPLHTYHDYVDMSFNHKITVIRATLLVHAYLGTLRVDLTPEMISRFCDKNEKEYRTRISEIYRTRCIALVFVGRGGATKDAMRIIARVVWSMRRN